MNRPGIEPETAVRGFRIHAADNVATLIDDLPAGAPVSVVGTAAVAIVAGEPIARGHKIALTGVAPGEPIIKFGVRIGHATQPIAPGAWVHLHNLASDVDVRSGTLDLHTGAPGDTAAAYA